MVAITSWIAPGGGIGLMASLGSPRWLPAGWVGGVAVGAAGAFVGGGLLTVLAGRTLGGVDLERLTVAGAAAVVVLGALRHAELAEPRAP